MSFVEDALCQFTSIFSIASTSARFCNAAWDAASRPEPQAARDSASAKPIIGAFLMLPNPSLPGGLALARRYLHALEGACPEAWCIMPSARDGRLRIGPARPPSPPLALASTPPSPRPGSLPLPVATVRTSPRADPRHRGP